MKRIVLACLLTLPLLALPGRALAWGWCAPPLEVDAGVNWRLNVHVIDWSTIAQSGPWYLYFPYEAHFQTAAPVSAYPNWPGPMMLEPNPAAFRGTRPVAPAPVAPGPRVPPLLEPVPGAPPQSSFYRVPSPPIYQPVGYFPAQTPAYWYGR
jgi:hypothetical protein